MPAVRVIASADIPAAVRLKEAAGWNQTETDLRNLLELAPAGCFGLESDGALAATTSAICFGEDLAWIGMVLTHPGYRGRGFARALMEHALRYLDGRVNWIKLDATDMGRPLYASLGFEDECAIERWGRAPEPANGESGGLRFAVDIGRHAALDRAAFGADRRALLRALEPIESASLEDGYALGRPGSKAVYFGPCVARHRDTARALLDWFLARHAAETIYWDLLPHNLEAVRLARAAGFQPLRQLVRMARRGPGPFAHDDQLVYAIAGFEFG